MPDEEGVGELVDVTVPDPEELEPYDSVVVALAVCVGVHDGVDVLVPVTVLDAVSEEEAEGAVPPCEINP